MTVALRAAQTVIQNALDGKSVWGNRVYPDMAAEGTARPYVVFNYVSGGDEGNRGDIATVRLVMSVKCVAARAVEAMDGAAAITALLDNAGEQEGATLPTDDVWHLSTVTQDRIVHLVEAYQGAEWIYHHGAQYVLYMEKK